MIVEVVIVWMEVMVVEVVIVWIEVVVVEVWVEVMIAVTAIIVCRCLLVPY
jgi:hypothetical protein